MITKLSSRSAAFTLVELMVVVAILGLIIAIAVPNYSKARTNAQRRICISNLRVIDHAKEQWAFESNRATGDRARRVEINRYIKGGRVPQCPAAGTYRYRPVGAPPICDVSGHELISDFVDSGAEDE